MVTGSWVDAAFADGDPTALAVSDELVDELLAADELVLVAPVYNLGVPAALKAWLDQVVRVGRTFGYDAEGTVGLVGARRAWIVAASGSTLIGSEQDFHTPYLRAILGLIGITDVRVVAADGHLADKDAVDRGLAAAAASSGDLVA